MRVPGVAPGDFSPDVDGVVHSSLPEWDGGKVTEPGVFSLGGCALASVRRRVTKDGSYVVEIALCTDYGPVVWLEAVCPSARGVYTVVGEVAGRAPSSFYVEEDV
jgi:hypothetical protein